MKLKIFGKLIDIFKVEEYDLPLHNTTSVAELRSQLFEKFPELGKTTFLVVVNGVKAENQHLISGEAEIALLPPYSGG
ncbi:MoaD/ThiS family protein [Chryseobacterium lineare]